MDVDRITHRLERPERDAAIANRLKTAELRIRFPIAASALSDLEREQDEIDAGRAGKCAERTPWKWGA